VSISIKARYKHHHIHSEVSEAIINHPTMLI
jgi:hypothetical protein